VTDAELSQLYQRTGFLVHRRCLQLLRSQSAADDAVQEVFMRVLRYHRDQGGESMLGWLYGIAANVCFDQLKQQARHRADADAAESVERPGAEQDPDRQAVVGAVLRQLDPRTREVGVRHFLDGMTQEEVADSTGYSRRTVGKKLALFEAEFRRLFLGAGGRS
jgi:RNA polymerase sigma-70 factor (ECF subfamily)